jgi:hypothetical protein
MNRTPFSFLLAAVLAVVVAACSSSTDTPPPATGFAAILNVSWSTTFSEPVGRFSGNTTYSWRFVRSSSHADTITLSSIRTRPDPILVNEYSGVLKGDTEFFSPSQDVTITIVSQSTDTLRMRVTSSTEETTVVGTRVR